MAAQAILDRGMASRCNRFDANITEDGGPVRYYAELPRKATLSPRQVGCSHAGYWGGYWGK